MTSHDQLKAEILAKPRAAAGYAHRDQIIRLGKDFKAIRQDVLGLTQDQAADLVGMKQSELSRLERGVGVQGPTSATLYRLTQAYGELLHRQGDSRTLELSLRLAEPDHQNAGWLKQEG